MRKGMAALAALLLAGCMMRAVRDDVEVPLGNACDAVRKSLVELRLPVLQEKRDLFEGVFKSRMADGRRVSVVCEKLSANATQVRVWVGDFSSEANQRGAMVIRDQIMRNLGVEPVSGTVSVGGTPRTYEFPVATCYERAMEACRKCGYQVSRCERRKDGEAWITAHGGDRTVEITILHEEGVRSRTIIGVSGGLEEARREEERLHDALERELTGAK